MSQQVATTQVATPREAGEPIAIVGIGCRLPGGADSPAKLWQLLCAEFDAITLIPPERFDVAALFDARPATPGKIMTRWGGFLEQIDRFDADFFGISPREAERLDPQQRLLLEVTWEALADAGVTPEGLVGSRTGVFVGMWLNEFEAHLFAEPDGLDLYMTTGSGRYTASGRISYFFDLLGASITVDTACSSSLVAVHLACQSIWSGECSMALAGGANVILQPHITIAYSQSRMMAPDGRCKFGDAGANGYVRSDGAAIVALKPLAAALADGDPVYAVICGSAVTNDGRSSGFLATPGQAGQEEMLRRAYARAGVDPRMVQYVEAHGTGTSAGDPVELGALGAVLGAGRSPEQPCLVGSLKTNLGHTEGAAGVAGMIKVALALAHHQIPASLHLREPNPRIPWPELGLAICAERRPWPAADHPATAGVSSFGIAGTNAHVVLQAAPPAPSRVARSATAGALVLPISAHTPAALADLARAYDELLAGEAPALADLCYTASLRAAQLDHRLAVVADSPEGLRAGLEAFTRGERHPHVSVGQAAAQPPRVAFVFPGQGSQWLGMARELMADEPAFRATLDDCDRAIFAEAGWSPIEQLAANEASARLHEIDVIQPTLFAIQVALAALWRSWGVLPVAVVGHSMGEIAAAHVAGALSLDDAVAIICRRSRLLRRVRGQGAMAVVDLSLAEAQAAIAGHEDRLAIAVSNSPRSTVLSGDPDALAAVVAQLERREVFCRPIKVDVASHSPQMDPLLDELRAALTSLSPRPAEVPIYSTVVGGVADGATLDADYWARNLRQPVLFATAAGQLCADGHTIFIEISPHPILLPAIEQVLRHGGHAGAALPSLRRAEPERATMLTTLGALYTAGAPVSWAALYPSGGRHARLPAYPWQRERFWYEHPAGAGAARRGGHPLLGYALRPASEPGSTCWETTLGGAHLAFLADHRVQGAALLPATGMVELALAAVEAIGSAPYAIERLTLREALTLPATGGRAIQLVLDALPGALRFRVYGATEMAADAQSEWRLHAEGRLRPRAAAPAPAHEPLAAIRVRCAEELPGDAHYQAMAARALAYGPAFQTVERCWLGEGEALGRLTLPTAADSEHAARITLLDGCLQLAVAALPQATAGQIVLPISLERLQIFAWPERDAELWGHAVLTGRAEDSYSYDVALLDGAGQRLAEVQGLRLQGSGRTAALDELLYELRWEPTERLAGAAAPAGHGSWLIVADAGEERDLAAWLASRGERCVVASPGADYSQVGPDHYALDPTSPDAYRALLRDAFGSQLPPCRGIVYALGAADGATAAERNCEGVVALVQALGEVSWEAAPRLWLLTRGAQPAGDPPAQLLAAQALLWGLGRVVASEYPGLRCTLIDRGPTPDSSEARALAGELWAGAGSLADDQVALRGARRYVARLVRRAARPAPGATAAPPCLAPTGTPFRLVAAAPGTLDSLRLREAAHRPPGPGELEVRVEAAGLNFRDVMKALGILPGLAASPEVALGAECAGTVVRVGPGVEGHRVGDSVIVITPSYERTSCLSDAVTVPAPFAVPLPAGLSMAEAAGLPVVFLTAYYALHTLGRMRRGERVLIHAAAGGVGLAAVQLCQRAGATIFATAGSPAKRDYLRSLGIEHVMDSRSLDFAEQVLALTDGRGVDLVLNSLVGEAIPASLATLAPRGRFLEIGKRDIEANSRIGLAPFKQNLSFFAIDLARLTEEDPAYVAGLFHEVMALVAAGELHPLPTSVLPFDEAAEAFRTMAQARHIGKLVLSLRERPATVEAAPAPVAPVRADATYLITGGLGGLGLEVARWLVARGARHLALLGRGAPSAEASAAITKLEAAGARVLTLRADVAARVQLRAALAQLRAELPPLRGVVHAAGLLADATLAQLTPEGLRAALAPKVAGALHLHELTLGDSLDMFVLFSSAAALLGLAGQANYAAGNAFLDTLAHQRRAAGLPALSINWGPWAEVGLAAAQTNRGARLSGQGLGSIAPAEGLAALELLLGEGATQAAVMRFDERAWAASSPGAAVPPLLAALLAAPATVRPATQGLREALLAADPGRRRRTLLEEAVRAQLAQVLRIAPERIDRQRPLKAMGLDSLMALELRTRLELQTGLTLSATLAWNYPTVAILAEFLAGRMALPLDAQAQPASAEQAAAPTLEASEREQFAQDELEAMLSDELAAVDRLLKAE